ncbi:MAG: shikimate dehydrogenase [Chlamydiota bacterium]
MEDLTQIYHYSKLNSKTELYGLIGDPITGSLGHIYHNKIFAEQNRNALYIKMTVKEEELQDFFILAKKMGFQGLSVTMPLKEKVLAFIDVLDPKTRQIKASNTLLFQEDQIFGTNTDGIGALDALQSHTSILGKTLVIIGAGGASRAIAFEAKKRGALLYIVNRTLAKAEALAKEISPEVKYLSSLPSSYNILINTTPNLDFSEEIFPSALVMDIVYVPKKTLFIEKALNAGCRVVFGEEMFTKQADLQATLFKSKKKPLKEIQELLLASI